MGSDGKNTELTCFPGDHYFKPGAVGGDSCQCGQLTSSALRLSGTETPKCSIHVHYAKDHGGCWCGMIKSNTPLPDSWPIDRCRGGQHVFERRPGQKDGRCQCGKMV